MKDPSPEVVKNLLQNKKCEECLEKTDCTREERLEFHTCEKWKHDVRAAILSKYLAATEQILKKSVRGQPNNMVVSESTFKVLSKLMQDSIEGVKNESDNSSQ